jgi:predicted transcriptional regulator
MRKLREYPFLWQSKPAMDLILSESFSPGTTLAVYIAFTRVASDLAREEFQVSMNRIAQLSGCSRRTVLRHVKELERLELLYVMPQFHYGKKASVYQMTHPDKQEMPIGADNLRGDVTQSHMLRTGGQSSTEY